MKRMISFLAAATLIAAVSTAQEMGYRFKNDEAK